VLSYLRMPKSGGLPEFRRPRSRNPSILAGARDLLRQSHLRATASRLAVLNLLLCERRPLSHAEVAHALHSDGFDRSTVFRNLRDLAEAAILSRVDLGDHAWRFELRTHDNLSETHHSHFVCERCSSVSCLDDSRVGALSRRLVLGAIVASVSEVVVRGCCRHC
jgi:Fur family transcriptional regulator, ferric uptake regulator